MSLLDDGWAFGAEFADPLASLDTSIPDGVDGALLAAYALGLADDALVAAQRMTWWCSRAPELELDLAWANVALDLLGQARPLLVRAATAEPALVPALPAGSPIPAEDALAFFREPAGFRNHRLVEGADADFAQAVVRLLLLSTTRLAVFERLRHSRDQVLAGVAAKGVPELAYHRDLAAQWFLVLAGGTEESRRRTVAAVAALWPLHVEALETHAVEVAAARAGVGADPADVREQVAAVLGPLLETAGVVPPPSGRARPAATGRDGAHTAEFAPLLDEMQSVARAHPMGRW
ncbi:1,2-phenylacetyl-CoA epoxidase subunit PaaC [Nocardioides ferulae]|uniref:1,2-phenylacetyl-CoA epoxidase subunit PaaC n=1 Tax=Nocardioides ferulae TaxID=2340821 RepID=UPI000EB00995|nr:1,2-phenylacetyl-CoA epoxidase subunit PaaC [Nocardioides ferulae]